MSEGFANPIVGGGGGLVYPSIHSPSFVHGSAGWSVNKDGSVEFNNGTFRGTITGSSLILRNSFGAIVLEITSSGSLFEYADTSSATQGALIASITGKSGTDPVTSAAYQSGANAYVTISGVTYAIGLNRSGASGAGLSIQDIASPPVIPAGVFGASSAAGATAQVVLVSGQITSGDVAAQIQAQSQTQSLVPNGRAVITAGVVNIGKTSTVVIDDNNTAVTVAGKLTATGGTPANPTLITTDIWNSLGTAGSTGCTLNQARYRLTPDGECEIDIALTAGAGGSTAGTYTWSNTLPAAYQFPGNYLRSYPMGFNTAITSGAQNCIIAVDGASFTVPGRVRMTIPAVPAGTVFTGTVRIPLN